MLLLCWLDSQLEFDAITIEWLLTLTTHTYRFYICSVLYYIWSLLHNILVPFFCTVLYVSTCVPSLPFVWALNGHSPLLFSLYIPLAEFNLKIWIELIRLAKALHCLWHLLLCKYYLPLLQNLNLWQDVLNSRALHRSFPPLALLLSFSLYKSTIRLLLPVYCLL